MAPLSVAGIARAAEPFEVPLVGANARIEDRYPERRITFPNGVTGISDVVYSTLDGFRPLTLDLYLPAIRKTPLPAILFVHGGGWMSGHARHAGAFENWPRVLASIAARGYVVASVNYRLSSEAASPAAELDIKTSIAWLRANAERLFLDKSRVGIWGASAGGQLAALAGTSCESAELAPKAPSVHESVCVQAVVTWYGIFDFTPLAAQATLPPPVASYLGCSGKICSAEQVRLASPARFIDRSDPPFLLVHGSRDRTVPVAQSTDFHAALQSAGVRSRLLVIADVDHSFIGDTPSDTSAASLQALHATLDFFDCELRLASCSR